MHHLCRLHFCSIFFFFFADDIRNIHQNSLVAGRLWHLLPTHSYCLCYFSSICLVRDIINVVLISRLYRSLYFKSVFKCRRIVVQAGGIVSDGMKAELPLSV